MSAGLGVCPVFDAGFTQCLNVDIEKSMRSDASAIQEHVNISCMNQTVLVIADASFLIRQL